MSSYEKYFEERCRVFDGGCIANIKGGRLRGLLSKILEFYKHDLGGNIKHLQKFILIKFRKYVGLKILNTI